METTYEEAKRFAEEYNSVHPTRQMTHRAAAWALEADRVDPIHVDVPQGSDGTAHYAYYNSERSLSFVWNGDATQSILVSHDGYGEPPRWSFPFLLFKPAWVIAGTKTSAMAFQHCCEQWIAAKEDE